MHIKASTKPVNLYDRFNLEDNIRYQLLNNGPDPVVMEQDSSTNASFTGTQGPSPNLHLIIPKGEYYTFWKLPSEDEIWWLWKAGTPQSDCVIQRASSN